MTRYSVPARAHGVRTHATPLITTSKRMASTTHATIPTQTSVAKLRA